MAPVIFIVLSLVTLACALVVVVSRNIFHSAVFLAFSFVGVAGLYFLLQAEFMAGIQILVYVGAIVTLIVFAIMLSRDLMDQGRRSVNRQWVPAAIASVLALIVLVVVVLRIPAAGALQAVAPGATVISLGQAMVDPAGYMLPFEAASVLLLVALVGSIILARDR